MFYSSKIYIQYLLAVIFVGYKFHEQTDLFSFVAFETTVNLQESKILCMSSMSQISVSNIKKSNNNY